MVDIGVNIMGFTGVQIIVGPQIVSESNGKEMFWAIHLDFAIRGEVTERSVLGTAYYKLALHSSPVKQFAVHV